MTSALLSLSTLLSLREEPNGEIRMYLLDNPLSSAKTFPDAEAARLHFGRIGIDMRELSPRRWKLTDLRRAGAPGG